MSQQSPGGDYRGMAAALQSVLAGSEQNINSDDTSNDKSVIHTINHNNSDDNSTSRGRILHIRYHKHYNALEHAAGNQSDVSSSNPLYK